ncbi:MAG: hypothetical protein ACJ8EH_13095 [Sphingomicrobium sp.]
MPYDPDDPLLQKECADRLLRLAARRRAEMYRTTACSAWDARRWVRERRKAH